MKPGPVHAARILMGTMDISASPKPGVEWIVDVATQEKWFGDPLAVREKAELWEAAFLSELRRQLRQARRMGKHAVFAFNSSSEYMIQGAAFVEPRDPDDVKRSKRRAGQYNSYVAALGDLTPRQFEGLCVGVLSELGVEKAVLTQYSADEGIDFFGKLRLEKLMVPPHAVAGIERQLEVWLIGQAKHYKSGVVSTFEVRDLVGAVELAKGKAFGSGDLKYPELSIRACDPVFYVLMTTGRLSAATWRLLDRSGVTGMDGSMVAGFLAEHGTGMKDSKFDRASLMRWLNRHLLGRPSSNATTPVTK